MMAPPNTSRRTALPNAPYSARPPSPPSILIPAPATMMSSYQPMTIVPDYANIDPASLSREDLEIITQHCTPQVAHDSASSWTYEARRTAQPVLDYLFLGPSSIARDRKWLQENGITMLLAARDSRMALARLMGVDRVAQELSIEAEHIDVSGHQELIRALPTAVGKINDHMLRVYREQAISSDKAKPQDGSMMIDKSNFRRGKVLVFCETGNDRSAGVVIAYLMTVLGMSMVNACQFIHYKRFCVSLDEDMKNLLKNYEDILQAQRMVHSFEHQNPMPQPQFSQPPADSSKKGKRGIEDTIDEDDEMRGTDDAFTSNLDRDRYFGRDVFVPFIDSRDEGMDES